MNEKAQRTRTFFDASQRVIRLYFLVYSFYLIKTEIFIFKFKDWK